MKIETFLWVLGLIGFLAICLLSLSYNYFLYKKYELDKQYQAAVLENNMQKYCEALENE
jgi:hypothetical protein